MTTNEDAIQWAGLESSADEEDDGREGIEKRTGFLPADGGANLVRQEVMVRDDGEETEREGSKPAELPSLLAPLVDLPRSGTRICQAKASNLVDFETMPFDPSTFEGTVETYEASGTKERNRTSGHNVVRWRKRMGSDGKEAIETNAKFVRWSDGSLQLYLGEDVLDVTEQDIGMDHRILFVRHPESLIQAQAKMGTRLLFHPSSLKSKSHKRLTAALGKRHGRVAKVVKVDEVEDPEKLKEEMERAEEKRIKEKEAMMRRQDKQLRKYDRPRPRYEQRKLTADFLEEEEEDEEYEEITAEGAREAIRSIRRPMSLEEEEEAERQILTAKEAKPHVPPLKRYREEQGEEEDVEAVRMGEELDDEEDDLIRKKSRKGKALALSDDED